MIVDKAVPIEWWGLLHFVWFAHYNDTEFKRNSINSAKYYCPSIPQEYIDYAAIELGTFNKDFDLYIVPEVIEQ